MIENRNKNRAIDLIAVILVTCFSLLYLLKDDIPVHFADDLTYHLNRFQGIANAFEEGQTLPKIYPYANYGYGYASPLFYCDFFLYPFGILFHFGLSAVLCFKLCVFFYTLLGNLFVYFIFKKETNNRLLTLIAVILYSCTNYHIQNIYVRAALGEILAMTFIPLVIHSIYKILVKKENCWIYLGISFSCLVMCHLISSLLYGIFFLVMIIVFIAINRKDISLIKKTLITILKGTVLAILLCAWYLFPMFEQLHSQTFWLSINAQYNDINSGTQTIKDVLTNIFALTDWNNFSIKDNASVGIILLILPLCNIFTKKNKYITIISIYSIILFLIILGVIPGDYLNIIQFYFRLYIVIFPLLIICSIYFLSNLNKQVIRNIVCVIICIYSIINVSLATVQTTKGTYYLDNNAEIYEINSINSYLYDLDYNHDELGGCEYLPYTENVDYVEDSKLIYYRNENNEFIDSSINYTKQYSSFIFDTNFTSDNVELLLPITYYKGYSAYESINGKWQKINITYSDLYKKVVIYASKGEQSYNIVYDGTTIQHFSLGVSIVGSLLLLHFHKKKV